jgi:hypothetical protein
LKLFSIFAGGLSAFLVVLGDSNLNLDLPFGVQSLAIEKALAHENYDTASGLHTSDIGRKTTYARRKIGGPIVGIYKLLTDTIGSS